MVLSRWLFDKVGAAVVDRRLLRNDDVRQALTGWLERLHPVSTLVLAPASSLDRGWRARRDSFEAAYTVAPGLLTSACGNLARGWTIDLNAVPHGVDESNPPAARFMESLMESGWDDALPRRSVDAALTELKQLAALGRQAATAHGADQRHILILQAGGAFRAGSGLMEAALGSARASFPHAPVLSWREVQPGGRSRIAQRNPAANLLDLVCGAAVIVTPSARWAAFARLLDIPVLAGGDDLAAIRSADTELLLAALLRDQLYFDPVRRSETSLAATFERLLFWRSEQLAHDMPTYCLGMNRWKRRSVTAFLSGPVHSPRFLQGEIDAAARAAESGGRVVAWASKASASLERVCAARNVPLLLMEDGFLRSRGLGSHHVRPLSLVLDAKGIYFDPRRPSAVEDLLQNAEISADMLARAERFRDRIVSLGVSKYNVGEGYRIPVPGAGRKVILVPGQVADDASIRLGAGRIDTNLAMLSEARARNPDAFIVYKPHPDVELSHRAGFIAPRELLGLADFVASNMSSDAAIDQAHEVWTMTSLLGLEALLRRKKVACFGLPFFAGWGLTQDEVECSRRTRRRTLAELVAVTYFLYPRYIDVRTELRITAEEALDLLAAPAPASVLRDWF